MRIPLERTDIEAILHAVRAGDTALSDLEMIMTSRRLIAASHEILARPVYRTNLTQNSPASGGGLS